MFSNARNIQISGGHYVYNSHSQNNAGLSGLDILRQNIAFGATHDSGERFDPPKCDPDTRVALIQKIMAWITDVDSQKSSSMLWLRGSAGVGKSSLAQTIAELCSKNGRLAGSFFFSRSALDRNDGRLLVSTLSYQLTSKFPAVRSIIKKAVIRDPLVLQLSLEGQMQNLFIEPINRVARSPIRRYITHRTRSHPRLVVVDGLDECSDPAIQCEILRVLSRSLQSLRLPFRFLIASRPEVHITRTFGELRPNTPLHEIDLLEDTFQADSDIRIFLVKEFKKIKEMHPLKQYLPVTWPADKKIEELVCRSSCQFIYASVAMRYIGSSLHQPVERLDIILGISPRPANDLPFAQLDELYIHILSSVDKIDIVRKILGLLIIPSGDMYGNYSTPQMLEIVLGLKPGDIELYLINLQSVIAIISPSKPIRILHASFVDFLVDPSRVGPKFYVNIGFSHATLARECIRSVTRKHQSTEFDWNPIIAHLKKAVLTENLLQDLLDFPFLAIFNKMKTPDDIWGWIASFMNCFDDQSTLFDREISRKIYTQLLLHLDTYLKRQLARCAVDDDMMDLFALFTCIVEISGYPRTLFSYPTMLYAPAPSIWHPDQNSWDLNAVVFNVVLILSGFAPYSKDRVRARGVPFRPRENTSQFIRVKVLKPLCQFFLDPERSGDYFVDGGTYAHTALSYFRQLDQTRDSSSYEHLNSVIRITMAVVLSKAAISKELVSLLTHGIMGNQSLSRNNIRDSMESVFLDDLEIAIEAYLQRANDNTG